VGLIGFVFQMQMMCLWSPAGGTAVRAAADQNLISARSMLQRAHGQNGLLQLAHPLRPGARRQTGAAGTGSRLLGRKSWSTPPGQGDLNSAFVG